MNLKEEIQELRKRCQQDAVDGVGNYAYFSAGAYRSRYCEACMSYIRDFQDIRANLTSFMVYTRTNKRYAEFIDQNKCSANRRPYYKWLLNHRFFKKYFLHTTVTDAVNNNGIAIDVTAPSDIFLAMCMLARLPDEFPHFNHSFNMFVKAGAVPDLAFLLVHVSPFSGRALSYGHNTNHTLFKREIYDSIGLHWLFASEAKGRTSAFNAGKCIEFGCVSNLFNGARLRGMKGSEMFPPISSLCKPVAGDANIFGNLTMIYPEHLIHSYVDEVWKGVMKFLLNGKVA